jgi:hypothetical protein
MQLSFEPFDGRSPHNIIYVVDKEDSNRVVGYIRTKSIASTRGIEVNLFDEKYVTFASTYWECFGFVKGVQAVLNHMTFSKYIAPATEVIPIQTPIERRI